MKMDVQKWIDHFDENHEDDQINWQSVCMLPDRIRIPLAESLAIFQLGESGSGSALFRFAKRLEGDEAFPNYEEGLRKFVAEEHRHAAVLKIMVLRLGGTILTKQWSDSIFRKVRKLVNLEFELQVLLAAELIAEAYYELLRRHVPDEPTQKACARIVKDEVGHVGFHAAFFRQRKTVWSRTLQRFWMLGFAVLHEATWRVVWWDHRRCFRALAIERREFARLTRKARHSWLKRAEFLQRGKRGRFLLTEIFDNG